MQCSHKTCLLAPNEVVVFLSHTDEVDDIAVGKRQHAQSLKVFQVRNALGILRIIHSGGETNHSIRQVVVFNLARLDQARYFNTVEAALLGFQVSALDAL